MPGTGVFASRMEYMSRNPQTHSHPHIDATRLSSLLLPLVAFVMGFVLMFSRTSLDVAPVWAGYLSLAVLAGIDSVIGGVRAGIEGKFHSDVFLSGFVVNTFVAVALAWFGDVIGIQDVYLAAVVVFAWRIFLNISLIRRSYIERARASRALIASVLAERNADAGSSLTQVEPRPGPPSAPDASAGPDVLSAQ
jgi:small basic protein